MSVTPKTDTPLCGLWGLPQQDHPSSKGRQARVECPDLLPTLRLRKSFLSIKKKTLAEPHPTAVLPVLFNSQKSSD